MRLAKRLFDFYINASLHIGFAVLALTLITQKAASPSIQIPLNCTIFFATIVGYNFLKYLDIFKTKKWHAPDYYAILIVSFLATLGFLFFFFKLNEEIQIQFFSPILLVLLYPFLRKLGWLKMFLVSFVVTYVTVFIPYPKWSNYLYVELLQRFLILISLLIPFEIIDTKTDAKTLNTLPQLFGINRTKVFGILLVIPCMILEFLKPNPSYAVLIIAIVTALFIRFTSIQRNSYFTSFWVESVPILWWILLLIRNF
jgi:hypothetical protein